MLENTAGSGFNKAKRRHEFKGNEDRRQLLSVRAVVYVLSYYPPLSPIFILYLCIVVIIPQ